MTDDLKTWLNKPITNKQSINNALNLYHQIKLTFDEDEE